MSEIRKDDVLDARDIGLLQCVTWGAPRTDTRSLRLRELGLCSLAEEIGTASALWEATEDGLRAARRAPPPCSRKPRGRGRWLR